MAEFIRREVLQIVCVIRQQQSTKCVSHLFSDILTRAVHIKCHQSELEMFAFLSSFSSFFTELDISFLLFFFVDSKKASKSLKIYILRPKQLLGKGEKKSPINFWLLCSFYVAGERTNMFRFIRMKEQTTVEICKPPLGAIFVIPFHLCITNQA